MAEFSPTTSEPYEALLHLAKAADINAASALSPLTVELIKLRVSQINGCAYCLRLHTRDALALGESADRIAVLSAWRETSYFTDFEQAALRVAEGVARVGHPSMAHSAAEDTSPLSREEVRAAKWVAIAIDALNRLSVTSGSVISPD
ncbi:MAG: carboxymuconolactone decarboxylase family protein [Actinomycetota bacterium]|nr:carboxymuconolactone decarboxylase family protein [Actinomycetota bacterium]MDP2286977.1 carboxymuconolactone decarboxylase family protein [Actinomycetota bacterium]